MKEPRRGAMKINVFVIVVLLFAQNVYADNGPAQPNETRELAAPAPLSFSGPLRTPGRYDAYADEFEILEERYNFRQEMSLRALHGLAKSMVRFKKKLQTDRVAHLHTDKLAGIYDMLDGIEALILEKEKSGARER